MGIKMSDTFMLPLDFSDRGDKGGELSENGFPIFMRGCKYKAEAAAIAINSYDTNQALIATQADQIKMLRDALHSMVKMVDEDLLGDCDSMHAEMVFTEAENALEATKEQS